jgi:hypothetical protein
MGTALTGLEIKDTYDGLVKTTDNGPLSGTLKKLTDGLGNDSSLSLSTTAASFSGTLAVTESVQVNNELVLTTNNAAFRIYRTTGINYFDWSSGQDLAFSTVTTAGGSGRAERMRLTSTGNVGIGTAAPASKLHVQSGALQVSGNSIDTVISYSTVGIVGTTTAHDLQIIRNSVEIARVTANGLTFNGDTAAANALDDYEEGTWTMGVSFGGASVGVTTVNNTGTYTKIGRQVTVNGLLELSSKGSSSGAARITGLPFTIPNTVGNYSAPSLRLTNIAFLNQFQGYGEINDTTIRLQESTSLGAVSDLTELEFANDSAVMVSFTYFV